MRSFVIRERVIGTHARDGASLRLYEYGGLRELSFMSRLPVALRVPLETLLSSHQLLLHHQPLLLLLIKSDEQTKKQAKKSTQWKSVP